MKKLLILLLSCLAPIAMAQTTEFAWNADSSTVATPSGTCTMSEAIFDTGEKNEGTASMKVTYPTGDVQFEMGCTDFGNKDLAVNWNSGNWVCQSWDMRIDSAFEWEVNQDKMKAARWTSGGDPKMTQYLARNRVDVSECGECDDCEGGDKCSVIAYDFDPTTNTAVQNWQSYTIGLKLETGSGNDDGQYKMWVNGDVVGVSLTAETYLTTGTDAVHSSWGSFAMNTFPQSPDGDIWFDDFEMITQSAECTPRGGSSPALTSISITGTITAISSGLRNDEFEVGDTMAGTVTIAAGTVTEYVSAGGSGLDRANHRGAVTDISLEIDPGDYTYVWDTGQIVLNNFDASATAMTVIALASDVTDATPAIQDFSPGYIGIVFGKYSTGTDHTAFPTTIPSCCSPGQDMVIFYNGTAETITIRLDSTSAS